jgi:uncharacterized UPF0160 family protein
MFWNKKVSIAVHSGNFHPDDVFSVALLSIVFDGKIKVMRTRDSAIFSKADFIVDVGLEYNPDKNRFDHHQTGGAGGRSNGIKYSSIGLLWKKYGKELCGSEKVADIIEDRIIQTVDADDEGVSLYDKKIENVHPFLFIDYVYDIKPTWKESNYSLDEAFLRAVSVVKQFLQREIKIENDNVEADAIVDKIYEESFDKRVIVFDNPYWPKGGLIKYPEPTFIVKPEKDGSFWRVTALNKEKYAHAVRKNFPESWWGKRNEEMIKVSGVTDATFCRNGGIFAGAKSKEGAIRLAELALEK